MSCGHHERAACTSDWYPTPKYPIAFCQRSEAHWSTAQYLNASTLVPPDYHDPLAQEASAFGEIVIQEVDDLGIYEDTATEQRQATRFSVSYDLTYHC